MLELLAQVPPPVVIDPGSGWSPASVIAVVGAIAGMIISIIAALRSGTANTTANSAITKADTAQAGVNSVKDDVRSVNEQITTVATNMPAPSSGTGGIAKR